MNQPQNITFDVPNAFELEKLSELHKAMGDFTRTKILWQLMQGEQCVNDLAKTLSLTNSAISHQLHALRITKLVRSAKQENGYFIPCRMNISNGYWKKPMLIFQNDKTQPRKL